VLIELRHHLQRQGSPLLRFGACGVREGGRLRARERELQACGNGAGAETVARRGGKACAQPVLAQLDRGLPPRPAQDGQGWNMKETGAREASSDWESVFTATNLTPVTPDSIMLFRALQPPIDRVEIEISLKDASEEARRQRPPPTPITVMLGSMSTKLCCKRRGKVKQGSRKIQNEKWTHPLVGSICG
jgi:hypothetical protein